MEAEYLDGKCRQYNLVRINDPRLDQKDKDYASGHPTPSIFSFTAKVSDHAEVTRIGEMKRLDSWILDADLDWMCKDPAYWRDVFRRAETETFIPGMGVYALDWNGECNKEDETSQYWKRLTWCTPLLQLGNRPDEGMWGKDKDGRTVWYGWPRTHVHWIRILRYWIRIEQDVLNAGARRELEDYPPTVRQGLSLAIELMTKDLDCVDNLRFAETGKPGEMRRFKRAAKTGCCGSEERYVIIGTKQYIIGCNYGH